MRIELSLVLLLFPAINRKRLLLILTLFAACTSSYPQEVLRYKHILITNDDGIEDADRLLALARSVKKVADRVSIVVAAYDRSGTSNHTTFGKQRSVLEVKCRYVDKENNIAAYSLYANPADCVLIGLSGLFGQNRPDLVLSGINGGANIGPDWFGSGTIGAVRTAALLGVKGIALSGFDDEYKESFTMIPEWVTRFISSGITELIGTHEYLTIGFPEIKPTEIKGVKIAERQIAFTYPERFQFKKIAGEDPHQKENTTAWSLSLTKPVMQLEHEKDQFQIGEGYIIITAMSIDENNPVLLTKLKNGKSKIPAFKP